MGDTIYVSPSLLGALEGVPVSYEEVIFINCDNNPLYNILASRKTISQIR